MAAVGQPWSLVAGGVRLRIRLTPGASRDAIEAVTATADGPAIVVRVRAVPEDGKANAALERLVAGWLGVAKGRVSIVAGHKSRLKTVMIAGDTAELSHRIEGRLGATGGEAEGTRG